MATPKQQPYLGQKDPKTGKVWAGDGWGWQAPATYARLAGQGQLNTQRNPGRWIDNNLRHLFATSNSLNGSTRLVGNVGFLPIYEESGGKFSSSTPAQRQVVHGSTVQPAVNALMAATNLGQRLLSGQPLRARKPEGTAAGRAILALGDQTAIGMGARPVGQLSQSQRDLLSSLPSSLATNVALGFVAPLRAAGPLVGQLAQKVPFLSAGAQQVLARGLSWGANAAVNEAASGILDDSTQGGAGDLLKAVGAPVPNAFLTVPEDDRVSAGLKSLIPGVVIGEALGLPFGLASKSLELAPNAMRLLREQRINTDVQRVRKETVNAGLQAPDGLGGYEFSRDFDQVATAAAATPAGAPAPTSPAGAIENVTPEQAIGEAAKPMAVGDNPTADGAVGPAISEADVAQIPTDVLAAPLPPEAPAPIYDPSLLEVDAAALALDRLDDGALKAVAAGEGPVLPRLERELASQPMPDVNPERSTLWTAAPAESLTPPQDGWRAQWEQLPNTELIGAAAPQVSPDLFEKTQAITGKSWEEFTRTDVLDGLSAMEQSGQVVLPQRLAPGQVLADVQGLQVDPARVQFRSGADPETGVAPGGPQIDRWDVNKEGRVAIWQDPQTGDQVLVDGHRRVDAARRLGIPTLPADELIAPTADAARLEGANINIAQGSAAPLDGGRALRQQGVADPAGLEAAGIPLQAGAGSLATARLPESVFRAAEGGALPEARAVAIGASGLDEAGMAAAARFSNTTAGQTLNDAEFVELMALSGPQSRPNPLAQMEEVKRELDSTGSYYAGPVKLDREVYDNGNSRNVVEVATANLLPPEFLAARGVTDPAQLSSRRQMNLLREFTMQELRKLPPGDYALDALTDGHAKIYSRWFDGDKVPGVKPADDELLAGSSWTYRPQEDPRSLVSQAASQQAAPTAVPTAATFKARLNEARLAAEVRKNMPAELQQIFDITKRQEGPVAQLIQQGGAEVGAGARPDVVANRIRRQVEQAAQATRQAQPNALADAAPDGAMAGPVMDGPLSTADRAALRAQLLQQAVDGGEVRPSAQPIIPSPDSLSVDPIDGLRDLEHQLRNTGTIQPDTPAARLLEEEARLAEEYAARDALIKEEMARAQREAAGFWDLPFEERVRQGLIDTGERVAVIGAERSRSAAGGFKQLIDAVKQKLGLGNQARELPAGTELFHGTSKEAAQRIQEAGFEARKSGTFPKQAGVYFALSPEYAKAYAGYGLEPGQVVAGVLPEGARVLDLTGTTFERFKKDQSIRGSLIDWAKGQGYTGLAYKPDDNRLHGYQGKDTTEVFLFDATGANRAVGAGNQLLESSGAAEGRESIGTTGEEPWFVDLGGDADAAIKIENQLVGIVQQVAGSDAVTRLADHYKWGSITPVEWGGDGKRVGVTRGSYHLMKDIVEINGVLEGTQRQLLGTAYHEAFHRVQFGLLTPQEMKVLESAFGLERINNYSGLSPAKVSSLERMAVAFQNYATSRRLGGNAMQEKMLAQLESQMKEPLTAGTKRFVITVATAFEKVLDFIDRVKNLAKGNGFQTVDDIFERVYSGQIARQRAFDSALELLSPNQVERAKTLQRWRKDNQAPARDIDALLSTLDSQIEELKAKATAGGC